MSYSVLVQRLLDLRVAERYAARALRNESGGMWNKFASGGTDPGATDTTITKPNDAQLFNTDEINALFDRGEFEKAYKNALDERKPAGDAMRAKVQSDILSSMQQAMRLRYSTRIRHMCAGLSRVQSLVNTDIELIHKDAIK